MRAYGIQLRDSRTCKYGCCHGSRAASKHVNVACSTDHARAKDFKANASRYGRGRARAEARVEARDRECAE